MFIWRSESLPDMVVQDSRPICSCAQRQDHNGQRSAISEICVQRCDSRLGHQRTHIWPVPSAAEQCNDQQSFEYQKIVWRDVVIDTRDCLDPQLVTQRPCGSPAGSTAALIQLLRDLTPSTLALALPSHHHPGTSKYSTPCETMDASIPTARITHIQDHVAATKGF